VDDTMSVKSTVASGRSGRSVGLGFAEEALDLGEDRGSVT
jgi:hypothetical protein